MFFVYFLMGILVGILIKERIKKKFYDEVVKER